MKYTPAILLAGLLALGTQAPAFAQSDLVAPTAEQIATDYSLTNVQKISALQKHAEAYIKTLAGQYLDQMDLSPAEETLKRATTLTDLTPQELAAALTNLGKLYDRQANYDKAIDTYEKILKLDVNAPTKSNAWKAIVSSHVDNGQVDQAIAIAQKQDMDVITVYKQAGDEAAQIREITSILNDKSLDHKTRWAAFIRLPYWNSTHDDVAKRTNLAALQAISAIHLPGFLKVDPNLAKQYLRLFKNDKVVPVFGNNFYTADLANDSFARMVAPLLLKTTDLSPADYIYTQSKYVNALLVHGDRKQAIIQLNELAASKHADAAAVLWAKLVLAGLSKNNGQVASLIKEQTKLADKDKAAQVRDAAQSILASGDVETAQSIFAAYEGLFAHYQTAVIDCAFMANAPTDVGSWLNTPANKKANAVATLTRPYGDNLKFLLLTDSSTTGRNTGDDQGTNTGDTDTYFRVAADARGIHMFFDLHDANAKDVMEGLLRGGSIEMYIAPGKNEPYHTFLPRWPAFTNDGNFITMYPNENFRLPSVEEGTLRTSIVPTANGFGMSMFLSWDVFYDKLPANGSKWDFEAIRWTRSGGRSFAGSESVHNRSSWGEIQFSGLTPENLRAIKRAIIFKAVTSYRASKKINEPVGQWADDQLGDPEFFQAKVVPLLAELDGYAEMVKKDMTDQQIDMLFAKAVPGWKETAYKVDKLRTAYLKEKYLSK